MIASVLFALPAVASILAVARSWSKRRRAGTVPVNLPRELRDARLLYAERLFTATGRLSISARVVRAYRVPSGGIVLLELKTRETDRPYLSDVIELSAQRAAIALQTGEGLGSRIRRRPASRQCGAKDPSGATDSHSGGEGPGSAPRNDTLG